MLQNQLWKSPLFALRKSGQPTNNAKSGSSLQDLLSMRLDRVFFLPPFFSTHKIFMEKIRVRDLRLLNKKICQFLSYHWSFHCKFNSSKCTQMMWINLLKVFILLNLHVPLSTTIDLYFDEYLENFSEIFNYFKI